MRTQIAAQATHLGRVVPSGKRRALYPVLGTDHMCSTFQVTETSLPQPLPVDFLKSVPCKDQTSVEVCSHPKEKK